MPEVKIEGLGPKEISFDEDGKATINSDEPVNVTPALPVTDIRINVLELTAVSLTVEDGKRIVRGTYADGGSFEVSVDTNTGVMNTQGSNVTSQIRDGDDRSHSVLSFLPRKKFVQKKTH